MGILKELFAEAVDENGVLGDILLPSNPDAPRDGRSLAEIIEDVAAEPRDRKRKSAPAIAQRRIGEKWQGPSGHWFTRNQQGHVVPAKAPGADSATTEGPAAQQQQPTQQQAAPSPDKQAIIAKLDERDLPPEKAQDLAAKVEAMSPEQVAKIKEAAARSGGQQPSKKGVVYPEGYKPPLGDRNQPNTELSEEARPQLTVDECKAAQSYSHGFDQKLNKALRKDIAPWGAAEPYHKGLQAAFAKAERFKEPVLVCRGLAMHDRHEAEAFVAPFQKALETGSTAPLKGYTSTTTNEKPPPAFSMGLVHMNIIAHKGLDMEPYSEHVGENELLLDDNTRFKVHSIERDPVGRYIITCEQVLNDNSPKRELHKPGLLRRMIGA